MGKKKEILNLYKLGKTNKEIQNITGYKPSSIRWAVNSSGNKSIKTNISDFTHIVGEFMLGSLLGDGSFSKDDRLGFGHCEKQLNYLEYKYNFLNRNNCPTDKISSYTVNNVRYKNKYTVYVLRTKRGDVFKKIRTNFYKDNKKIVPNDKILYEYLTPYSLAIWFMDDGNAASHNNLQLNTQSFSVAEVNTLRYILLDKFDIRTTINSSNVITIRSNSYEKFIELIDEYVLDSLKYKYKLRVLNKSSELLEHPGEDNQQPSINLND